MAKKAQASVEYLFLVMVLLIILLPVVYVALNETRANVEIAKGKIAVNRLANAADSLYAAGEGSRTKITLDLPAGVDADNSYVEDKEISYRLRTPVGTTDVFAVTKGDLDLNSSLPTAEGSHFLLLEMSGGMVHVWETQ